jgi:hypothetical protein
MFRKIAKCVMSVVHADHVSHHFWKWRRSAGAGHWRHDCRLVRRGDGSCYRVGCRRPARYWDRSRLHVRPLELVTSARGFDGLPERFHRPAPPAVAVISGEVAPPPDIFRPIRDWTVDQAHPTQLDEGKTDRRKLV